VHESQPQRLSERRCADQSEMRARRKQKCEEDASTSDLHMFLSTKANLTCIREAGA
jgi:hypothetical protein